MFNNTPKSALILPKIIAHRGAPLHAPENTLAALDWAHRLKAQWVECDVQLTSDHQAIIFHDDTLNRTSNGFGEVARTSYDKIATLDAGSWLSPEFTGEKIPTLSQFLKKTIEYQMGINIELKGKSKDGKILAQLVLKTIQECWPSTLPLPLLSSFNLNYLEALRDLNSPYPSGMIFSRWNSRWKILHDQLNCYSIHIHYKKITQRRVDLIKNAGLKILAYTVNDIAIANNLWAMGVDGIFSDHPNLGTTEMVEK